MPFSRENRHATLSLIAIIVGLLVVGIGVQAYLAQQTRIDRDQARSTQDRADRKYADCLTNFAADLVNTLQAGREATAQLNEARDRKDKALDRLISISAEAQASGAKTEADLPKGLLHRYERALVERVAAQKAYNKASRQYEQSRVDNPLVSPKVVCKR